MKTLKDVYFESRTVLEQAGIRNADQEARLFIKHYINVADINIIISSDRPVDIRTFERVRQALERRVKGEPPGRIFGETVFWGLPMTITPDVLEPRQDTETLIDVALKNHVGAPPAMILDLGTGSGCIIIALLHEWRQAQGVATDISENALAVAKRNAGLNGVEARLKFVESDWTKNVSQTFDLVVANPPYIANHEIPNLPENVRNFDPHLALQAGNDGLDCYRLIIPRLKKLLVPGGKALLEIGISQGESVARLVEDSGLFVQGVHPDMAGIPRVVEISFGEK